MARQLLQQVLSATALLGFAPLILGGVGRAQQQTPPIGLAPAEPKASRFSLPTGPDTYVPLPAGPSVLDTEEYKIRVVTLVNGLSRPWSFAFLPDNSMLLTERTGRLRIIRNNVLDPEPVRGVPEVFSRAYEGLMDVVLHPRFAENRLVYLSYSKRSDNKVAIALARGRFDGKALTDVRDIFVADPIEVKFGPTLGSKLAFDRNGLLYMSLAAPPGDWGLAQDPGSHRGKVLRLRDDGTVAPDNPFVNRGGYRPEIYTLGHRNPLGLAFHPVTGELWSTEQGPQGGDELNLIQAGKNYGWPRVSLGRHYDGASATEGFTAPGLEEPVVFWVPAIAVSGLSFYNGDKFPTWKGNALVGAMRAGTGQYVQRVVFNDKALPTGRESMLVDLKQRIRDVRPGPDGFLYVLTDQALGAMLKIEPVP